MSLASNYRNIIDALTRKIGFKLDKEEADTIYASKESVDAIERKIPSSASSTNKLLTLSDLPVYNGGVSDG